MHCALYKEVSNGKEWTGWRLPTKQEISYMIETQQNNTGVMIEVLPGHYYWSLDGGKVENPSYTGGNATFTRCVRDMTKEELDLINEFE